MTVGPNEQQANGTRVGRASLTRVHGCLYRVRATVTESIIIIVTVFKIQPNPKSITDRRPYRSIAARDSRTRFPVAFSIENQYYINIIL